MIKTGDIYLFKIHGQKVFKAVVLGPSPFPSPSPGGSLDRHRCMVIWVNEKSRTRLWNLFEIYDFLIKENPVFIKVGEDTQSKTIVRIGFAQWEVSNEGCKK
jgi:hypothetical protein